MGTGAAKITNKNIPVRVHTFFFEKIACAETAEPRMTVSYTTNKAEGRTSTYIKVAEVCGVVKQMAPQKS